MRKSFGKSEIIRGANLAVQAGERVAIIGPNGAGKSTLFNLISGRFAPTSGEIHLHGRRTINEVSLLWREWFDGLYADGATTGRMMVLHLHPWIIGQPWRIRHLDEVLGHICARQGVWKATGGQIINWFRSQSSR